ncbi:MAG: O-methyltransferase [Alphaproteobacteria bacterium]
MPIEQSIFDLILDVCDLRLPQDTFDLEVPDSQTIEEMASSPVALSFLQCLVTLRDARSILEIGTFIGVSGLYMAKTLPDDGHLVTIEKFDQFAAIARRNFERNGLSDKIELINGSADEVLPSLVADRKFDLVFIDGHKEAYAAYLDMVVDAVTPGGIVVIDDALFHGDVMNADFSTEKGSGVHAALMRAKELSGWRRVLLPVSNGMLLLMKPGTQNRVVGDE